jgi:hypothetical protein
MSCHNDQKTSQIADFVAPTKCAKFHLILLNDHQDIRFSCYCYYLKS